MGSQGDCVSDDSSYTSPVPVIGLYIMGATLVYLSFILVDVYAGFRNRKRWLPCRFFSLNSITLTLLSIVAKLPADLTSPMPRVQDQLSKLTGTALICISMGFFMPSIGTYTESEYFSNMVALTIFEVTVVVNICIQMHTGATFQTLISKRLEFCKGSVSVYKWSMMTIVVTQVITTVVGGLAIIFRQLTLISHLILVDGADILRDGVEDAETIIAYNPIVQTDFFEDCCDPPDDVREEAMKEFKELIDDEGENGLDEWTLKKGFNDMERGIEKAKASDQLITILSKVSLSTQDESLVPQLKAHYNSKRPGSLDEVFEILDFVDKKMSSSSFENKKKSMLAKALWKGGDFRILLAKIARYHVPDSFLYPRSQLDRVTEAIEGLKKELRSDYMP
ncbi:hypothetical protein Sjap_009276 [Stephania japonica]|uniref:Uncharacterized protein n=1 Tax=Stephania japonica TaxID=461633 RepID=A0AAP0PC48_9MAGN